MKRLLCKIGLHIEPREIAAFIRRTAQAFKANPLLNLSELAYAGMVIASIGFIKNIDALKLLGDLISDAPDKLRSLITLHYSVLGTLGDIQAMIETVTKEAIERDATLLEELADIFDTGKLDENKIIQILGKFYDLLVVKNSPQPLQYVSKLIHPPYNLARKHHLSLSPPNYIPFISRSNQNYRPFTYHWIVSQISVDPYIP
ncbi:MAG TPA: hypothetical protein EYP08_06285 [Pyrodictiaceae archaeon]|nr:hypothetical protein [Pyrodictiaceae archaeon]